MRRQWLIDAGLVGLAAVAIAMQPAESRLDLLRAAIFIGGLVLALRIVNRLAPRDASASDIFEVPTAVPASPEIGELRRLELDVQLAMVHPYGVAWVSSLLGELAAGRLRMNRGIDMERDPAAARRVVGETLWRLVQPGAGRWPAGGARISAAEIDACVAVLERV